MQLCSLLESSGTAFYFVHFEPVQSWLSVGGWSCRAICSFYRADADGDEAATCDISQPLGEKLPPVQEKSLTFCETLLISATSAKLTSNEKQNSLINFQHQRFLCSSVDCLKVQEHKKGESEKNEQGSLLNVLNQSKVGGALEVGMTDK